MLFLVISSYFASCEIALASVNKVRMKSYAEDGNKQAKYVMYILNNFDKALTTLLIGNNLMHIGCSALSVLITRQLFAGAGPSVLAAALTVSTVIITLVVFFFAEMLPKAYAKACNEKYSLGIGHSLYILMKVLTPLSVVFSAIGRGIGKLFIRGGEAPSVTENELVDIIETFKDDREEDDEQEDATAELMVNVIKYSSRTVSECYTPWDQVEKLDESHPIEDQIKQLKQTVHSRLPVVNSKGNVIGVVLIRAFFREYVKLHDKLDLVDLLDTPYFVRPDMPVDELLLDLSKSRTHIAFVSERSDILGIITVEDILEELVGEIFDEYDPEASESPKEVKAQ
ncbi:MAG: HlyC/CorC family transporter [Clostridia bacterium]|nr:HlyC/CorC family transporter [Clostridia bacterium]